MMFSRPLRGRFWRFVSGYRWLEHFCVLLVVVTPLIPVRLVRLLVVIALILETLGARLCFSAFTAYQFSVLFLEKLELFINAKRAGLVSVSDTASLSLVKDIPKPRLKICLKTCL